MSIVIEEIVFNPIIQVDETIEEIIIQVDEMQIPVTKESIGLGNVDNTSDLNKPISTAVSTALNSKLNIVDYNDRFKGVFLTLAALNLALPTASAGDSAQVNEVGAIDVINYSWDAEENIWVQSGASGSGASNTDALPEGTSNLYFTTARVLATLINGVSFLVGTPIVSTDTILIALGKLQKQITDNNSNTVKYIIKEAAQGANVTGTGSETILYSKLIPANTFKDGDFMTLFSRIARPSPTASSLGVLQRVKINTSNTLTGAIQIALNTFTGGVSGNQFATTQRTFNVTNGFLIGTISSQSYPLDIGNSNTPPQFNIFDPTVDNYIFITGQLGFSGDTMYHLGTKITN